MADNGMELLSEACAAVSPPKFPSNIFEERPIQHHMTKAKRQRTSPSRQGFLSIQRRELGDESQGVYTG